jgi:hypothetical protein
MKEPNGYTLWENDSVIVVATGFTEASENDKTGGMIQTHILNKHVHPVHARRTGEDEAVCGDCPLRRVKDNGCYVNWLFVGGVYKAWHADKYPMIRDWDVFHGRDVRMGSSADPAFSPPWIWATIAKRADNWTGYTHQWRWAEGLKPYCVASTSEQDYQEAIDQGWKVFVVVPPGHDGIPGMLHCQASKEAGKKTQCNKCHWCKGTGSAIRQDGVWIHGHGTYRNYIN